MTKEEAKKIIEYTFLNADGHLKPLDFDYGGGKGIVEALRMAIEALSQPPLPSNLDEAVQPEWRKAPISFMGGAIIKTSIGPMYSDHVVAGQLYLKFEELHLLPGYDEN